jgi:hypothetical protein
LVGHLERTDDGEPTILTFDILGDEAKVGQTSGGLIAQKKILKELSVEGVKEEVLEKLVEEAKTQIGL